MGRCENGVMPFRKMSTQVLFRKKGGILVMNKEKALKNQGLEFREDILYRGGDFFY